jgi:hypothetical protein
MHDPNYEQLNDHYHELGNSHEHNHKKYDDNINEYYHDRDQNHQIQTRSKKQSIKNIILNLMTW